MRTRPKGSGTCSRNVWATWKPSSRRWRARPPEGEPLTRGGRMLGRPGGGGPLEQLTPRERDVLAAMAEGKSNQGIAEALVVTEAAVERHVTGIFQKLGLGPTATEHRRGRAVLAYLKDPPRPGPTRERSAIDRSADTVKRPPAQA